MSAKNTEMVRQLMDSFSRILGGSGEIEEGIAEVIDLLDPEIEYVNPAEAIDPGTRHGIDGWITALRNLRDALGIYRMETERLMEDGDDVAGRIVQWGKAPGSGVEMAYPPRGGLWSFRNGRLARFEWFVDPEGGFAKLGRRY